MTDLHAIILRRPLPQFGLSQDLRKQVHLSCLQDITVHVIYVGSGTFWQVVAPLDFHFANEEKRLRRSLLI